MQELSVDASSQKLMQSENERKIKETQLETIDTRLKGNFVSIYFIHCLYLNRK